MGLSTTMAALGENEEEITAEEQRRIKKVEGGAEAAALPAADSEVKPVKVEEVDADLEELRRSIDKL